MYTIKKNKYKNIMIISTVLLLVAATGFAYFLIYRNNRSIDRPENTPDYNAPTNDQKKAGEFQKKEFNENKYTSDSKYTDSSTNKPSDDVNVETSFTYIDKQDDTYQFRVIVQSIDNNGSCKLELIKDSLVVLSKDTSTQALGLYTVCNGFDVDSKGLAKGSWTAKVTYSGTENRIGSAQKGFEVK